jgi:predicted transcriptional regulator
MRMHVHVLEDAMRTTIEIDDSHRAKLLELAARRREKGFSRIIGAAIDMYLESLERDAIARSAAVRLRGSLSAKEVDRLRAETGAIRKSWR